MREKMEVPARRAGLARKGNQTAEILKFCEAKFLKL